MHELRTLCTLMTTLLIFARQTRLSNRINGYIDYGIVLLISLEIDLSPHGSSFFSKFKFLLI
jgi:hypothetical protein